MPALSKQQLQRLSNLEFARHTEFSKSQVKLAFRNYNRLIDFVHAQSADPRTRAKLLLDRAESPGLRDLGEATAAALLEIGPLKNGIGELAAAPRVSVQTIVNLIPALLALDLPGSPAPETIAARTARRSDAPRAHYRSAESLAFLAGIADTLSTPAAFSILPSALDDLVGDLAEDLEKIKDLGEEGRDLLRTGNDILREVKKAAKALRDRERPAFDPRSGGGGVVRGATPPPEQIDGEIDEDTYRQLFGAALAAEPAYTAWLDRLMAFEVDGAGDDNVFWTVEARTFLRNPDKVIRTSFISNVYNIDEREEYRLKPNRPIADRRARPLAEADWDIRGFLEKKDACLALRVNGDVRGIPLSKLDKVEVDIYLYESDSVNALIRAVAALGAAAIAAFGIIQGRFSAPPGSTQETSDALERALTRLNELINSDDKVFEDSFTFRPAQFEAAFRNGQTFAVRQRQTTAAMGLPFQRTGGGKRENGRVLDTEDADAFFADNDGRLRDPDFYEDEFASYYELRVRFEREDPA